MATDVDVQFFSHLNGLVLGNNWGDMIRLLDACLVNGVTLPSVTSASIDEQGDVHLTLFAPHKALLLQVVELTDFEPLSLNQKYRIKGVPSPTQLILKPQNVIAETAVTTKGTGKLASLGYDIIFRDDKDVKRVYRAKNPTAQHPFIRVDESISDGTNSYHSSYAKYAMVGLLEHMDHIDDYQDPNVLQLPFDPTDPAKNWKITGTGTSVVRGWSRWYYSVAGITNEYFSDSSSPSASMRNFTLCGDANAFYLLPSALGQTQKQLVGCGLFDSSTEGDKSWFMMTYLAQTVANISRQFNAINGGSPMTAGGAGAVFFLNKMSVTEKNYVNASGVLPDLLSGYSAIYSSTNTPAMDIPVVDSDKYIRGILKFIKYMGKSIGSSNTTVELSNSSMYVKENVRYAQNGQGANTCGFYFYLGELE